ncbi:hypothetical protein [Olsenella profusa]|uniref:Uncharacterized protein n=1 Tax=Olsenella profusa F0195 TaxID=1125712 RepID=U2T9U9_9ACTN|nr:hypothetical protein [Olsenella profusa]ERL09794.1 hypothetical protein HMPREF1316_1534 [Olsenella profusa F0195]
MITTNERREIAASIGEIDWAGCVNKTCWCAVNRLCEAMGLEMRNTYVEDVIAIAAKVRELCDVSDDTEDYQRGFDEGFASADDWYADRTDAELAAHGLMRLPIGADGEPIRPGDVVTHPDMGSRREVTSVYLTDNGVSVGCADGFVTLRTGLFSHADTPSSLADEIDRWIDAGQDPDEPYDHLHGIAERLRRLGSDE